MRRASVGARRPNRGIASQRLRMTSARPASSRCTRTLRRSRNEGALCIFRPMVERTIDARLGRIGVVMMSAVGDAVHVLPVLNAIKRHSPSSHVTWVLQLGPATLVRGHRAVDDIILF